MYGIEINESQLTSDQLRVFMMDHAEFHNRVQTFRGTALDAIESEVMVLIPDTVRYLTEESALAFAMDQPDYVVWSANTPIAWHSTTRGIDHRTDKCSWEWTMAKVMVWQNPQTIRRFNRLVPIVRQLNSPT
jgi:hypothetical protein